MSGQVISYGAAGEDDLAIDPAAIQYLDAETPFILLDEGDDADPAENEEGWPIVRGDRIVWASDETDSEPIAVVIPGRARDNALLIQVARSVAADAGGALVEIVRYGDPGPDDVRLSPAAEARLAGSTEFTMLDVGEDDPPEEGVPWPLVRGDRVMWAVDDSGEEAEPVALVRADRVGDEGVLEDVGLQWTKDSDEIRVVVAGVSEPRAAAPAAPAPAAPPPTFTSWADLSMPEIGVGGTAAGSAPRVVVDEHGRVLDYNALLALYREQQRQLEEAARRIAELESEVSRLRDPNAP